MKLMLFVLAKGSKKNLFSVKMEEQKMELTGGVRSRAWCFTLNNPTEEEGTALMDKIEITVKRGHLAYAIVGNEEGKSGTNHLQGYCYFHNPRNWSFFKKICMGIHLELAKGSPKDNQTYCSKEGEFIEWGVLPIGMGHRTDLDELKKAVLSGSIQDPKDVWLNTNPQTHRYIEKGVQLYAKKRDWVPTVIWMYGPSETGKSRLAYEICSEPRWVSSATMSKEFFFEGYQNEERCVFDEFRRGDVPFRTLLRILDRYEARVNIKGTSAQFLGRLIIITSNIGPEEMYAEESESIKQLLRRITLKVCSNQEGWQKKCTEVAGNTNTATCVPK